MRFGTLFKTHHRLNDHTPAHHEPLHDDPGHNNSGHFDFGHHTGEQNDPAQATADGDLISAFFGLDDGIGPMGQDGLPVVFETEVDVASLDAEDFLVTTASGEVGTVQIVTPFPANDDGEMRTILLVGDFGSADDQPVTVEIVGDVLSEDGTVNYNGAAIAVIPLEAGPSLVFAEVVPEEDFGAADVGTIPEEGGTVIRTTWDGGVTQPDGTPLDETDLANFTVSVELETGEIVDVNPVAMSDLGDNDNNQLLYIPVEGTPLTVSFAAQQVTDPNGDFNEATQVDVAPLAEDTGAVYDSIIYFGDSFTDSGEIYNLTGELLVQPLPSDAFGYDGQVSNGPVYADYAPELMGIEADGSLNYAVGGARAVGEQDLGAILASSPLARPDPNPEFTSYDINLGAQVDRFLEDAAQLGDLSGSAASITIGLNDFRQLPNLIDPANPNPAAIQAAASQLSAQVLAATMQAAADLATAGVGTIILGTLPLVSRENPTPEQDLLNGVVGQYNDALMASVAGLEQQGIEVVVVDLEAMFLEMTANGSNYGFLNTLDARLDGPQLIDPDGDGPLPPAPGYDVNPEIAALDADQHVFWDTIHPTTAAHGVLGAFQASTLSGDSIEFLGDEENDSHGSFDDDLIFAQGGNDTIRGQNGDDAVFGGAGEDRLGGGAGSDILAGGDGQDRVHGGRGADVVAGNGGDDRLFGGHGDDALIDGLGSDYANGGHGDDVFFYTEAELIGGTNGTDQDVFIGGGGDDTLYLVVSESSRAAVEAELEQGLGRVTHFEALGLTTQGIENVVLLDDRAAFGTVMASPDLQPVLDEAEAWNLI